MNMKEARRNEEFLKIYKHKSELVHPDGCTEIFEEGATNDGATARSLRITKTLKDGFLDDLINDCKNHPENLQSLILSDEHKTILDTLVSSITSEVGRALVGLSVLQLAIKAIEPLQSIRLHKGGKSDHNFSWKEGISMRSLDKNFITPILRHHSLLRLNADGFMMTRSLAENYPYSILYKANLRGARVEWLLLVEIIENDQINANSALRYLIYRLLDVSDTFTNLARLSLSKLKIFLKDKRKSDPIFITHLIKTHIDESSYAARLMEISMHSLFQAFKDLNVLEDLDLVPLSQMRSANKKHGNIGDIEFKSNNEIIVAWDAKYGKAYLRDELEELVEKLPSHTGIKDIGFVTSEEPERLDELQDRIQEIEDEFDVQLLIIAYVNWVERQFVCAEKHSLSREDFAAAWLTAYVESLAQKRRTVAPIDEPCQVWLEDLILLLKAL